VQRGLNADRLLTSYRTGFARSPSSYEYFGAPELFSLLKECGFEPELFGDCPVEAESLSGKAISAIRSVVVRLGLMPNTLKAREKLKRIFFGKLMPMPSELTDAHGSYVRPLPISCDEANRNFKVLFAVGTIRDEP
jgi:hypothetical protein